MYRCLYLLLAIVATVNGKLVPALPILDGRIVGGESTTIQNFPYQVSVRLLGSHVCGGSIINSRVVITAAHCIYSVAPFFYSVQYGSTNINDGKTVKAVRLIRHGSYNENTIDHDVALIHLAENVVFGSNAQPIALASQVPHSGVNAVVSGWGTVTEGGALPRILQKVNIQIVDRSVCSKQYAGLNTITDRMLCAGVNGGGKDACQGDSGGPLVANNQLVGIVSWGYGCARPNYAGVYSNIANLRHWIDSNIVNK